MRWLEPIETPERIPYIVTPHSLGPSTHSFSVSILLVQHLATKLAPTSLNMLKKGDSLISGDSKPKAEAES